LATPSKEKPAALAKAIWKRGSSLARKEPAKKGWQKGSRKKCKAKAKRLKLQINLTRNLILIIKTRFPSGKV
jgi:hypothetical protein